MKVETPPEDRFFIPFDESIENYSLPEQFTYPFEYTPHPLSLLASAELQRYLVEQKDWVHNFGLNDNQDGAVIGKMFGVLVVRTKQNNIGYLAAFSGKLANGFHHAKFVPPIYDSLETGSFLNLGMSELTNINLQIRLLKELETNESKVQIAELKQLRKTNSITLQNKLFDQFVFLDQIGEQKSLRTIFKTSAKGNPPAGAGECAAPKLLQYAFQQQMQPLALAEFWWGLSPKSQHWKHGHYYPACREKCAPILRHMLKNTILEEIPA